MFQKNLFTNLGNNEKIKDFELGKTYPKPIVIMKKQEMQLLKLLKD